MSVARRSPMSPVMSCVPRAGRAVIGPWRRGTFRRVRIGADSGGTFTDIVGTDGRILKIPSTADDPGRAVRDGIAELAVGDEPVELLAHGTTVATNALLERRGADRRAGDDRGLRRRDRDRPSGPAVALRPVGRPARAAGRPRRTGSRSHERVAADGAVLVASSTASAADGARGHRCGRGVPAARRPGPGARARGRRGAARPRAATCARRTRCRPSSASTSARSPPSINAVPATGLSAVPRAGSPTRPTRCVVMTSAGGLLDVDARRRAAGGAAALGPGGRGARRGGRSRRPAGSPTRSSFDMGGTSTDVCLILDGAPAPAAERQVAGLPGAAARRSTSTPSAPAGAASPASTPAARCVVGPASAGRRPGPACYGRGGDRPTVTDANLVARPHPRRRRVRRARRARPGRGAPRRARRTRAWTRQGVIDVVDAGMEQALRAVSVERGVDPAGLALVAFGGAGPLHACALAEASAMPTVHRAGRAPACCRRSACSSRRARRELVRTWPTPARPSRARRGARRASPGRSARCGATSARSTVHVRRRPRSTAATRARATNCVSRRSPSSPPRTVAATATTAGRRRRGDRAARRRRAAGAARRSSRCSPAGPAGGPSPWSAPGWSSARTARSGCPTGWVGAPGSARLAGPRQHRRWHVSADERARSGAAPGAHRPARRASRRRWARCCDAAAFSPNIKERADCSAAVFDASGRLLAQAEHIPVHLGSMPASVRGGDRRRSATTLAAGRPGDRQRPVRGRHAPQRRDGGRAVHHDGALSAGSRTGRTTPTSAARRPARCRPTRPRSSRRVCASRRCG